MRVKLLKDYKGLRKESEHEVKDFEGNLVEDGRTMSGVQVVVKDKVYLVPIDLIEFIF